MTPVEFSPGARDDLLDIADYLSERSTTDAFRLIDAVERAQRMFTSWPLPGHKQHGVDDDSLRIIRVHRHFLMVYRYIDGMVEVVTIVDGRSNVLANSIAPNPQD